MLYTLEENKIGRKYTVIPKEGTVKDWENLLYIYKSSNVEADFNTINMITMSDDEVPYFKVTEDTFKDFKPFMDRMTIDKVNSIMANRK